ncbi:ribosome maturation factor RimP [Jatrophihabitans sp. GAS493]|uniref:ribosome maturation factor RimP n=1 Tax=Jatrophihabitans sp. GAS493 TaxID=1907575 RepID=UPI000BB80687|nr:ribosome maturation factor RimP [Jatrophihabitans sp. GAS493]SOD74171.1 ribosome maturation factor RimP [Jatrophihabitans sp. GAS493]
MSAAKAGPPDARSAKVRDQLREVLSPVVAEAGYDLEELTVKSVGRRSLVRVVVDADGGIDLDAIASVSRLLSDALDDDTSAGGQFNEPFVLEVTSPGVDRPLTEPRHWRRAAGRLVKVTVDGTELVGRVSSAGSGGVELLCDGSTRSLSWGDLGPGRVQVEFNRGAAADLDNVGSDADDLDAEHSDIGAEHSDDLADDETEHDETEHDETEHDETEED